MYSLDSSLLQELSDNDLLLKPIELSKLFMYTFICDNDEGYTFGIISSLDFDMRDEKRYYLDNKFYTWTIIDIFL